MHLSSEFSAPLSTDGSDELYLDATEGGSDAGSSTSGRSRLSLEGAGASGNVTEYLLQRTSTMWSDGVSVLSEGVAALSEGVVAGGSQAVAGAAAAAAAAAEAAAGAAEAAAAAAEAAAEAATKLAEGVGEYMHTRLAGGFKLFEQPAGWGVHEILKRQGAHVSCLGGGCMHSLVCAFASACCQLCVQGCHDAKGFACPLMLVFSMSSPTRDSVALSCAPPQAHPHSTCSSALHETLALPYRRPAGGVAPVL